MKKLLILMIATTAYVLNCVGPQGYEYPRYSEEEWAAFESSSKKKKTKKSKSIKKEARSKKSRSRGYEYPRYEPKYESAFDVIEQYNG